MIAERHQSAAAYAVIIAAAAVAGGFFLDHGKVADLLRLNALLLVLGGTLGAVAVGTPSAVLASALRRCNGLLRPAQNAREEVAHRIMDCAVLARRSGLASIEPEAEGLETGLLRRALLLTVDGVAPQELRRQLQIEIAAEEDRAEADARVFEQAGGYAPTIGIIGAVIGLIQVMRQLGDVETVGRGIAAAFTATLYGVALANVVLLPLAARIRARAKAEIGEMQLILEGVTALGEGLSLRLLRSRLELLLEPGDAAPRTLTVSEIPAPKARRMSA